jgi:micrococcal nuclease
MNDESLKILFKLIGMLIALILGPNQINAMTDLPDGNYEVVDVVDGDTIKINNNGTMESIRFIGIDTPELHDPRKEVECFAQEASNIVEEKLSGQIVYLESDNSQNDKDKYDRYLRYIIMSDETNLNLWLIKNGFAYEYTYDLPYNYQIDFVHAENDARLNNVGLWNMGTCAGER